MLFLPHREFRRLYKLQRLRIHFLCPFLLPLINNCVGDKVTVVDIAYETIEELKQILATGDLLNDGQEPPVREFYVSGCSDSFSQVGRLLLGDEIKRIEKIELD